MKNTILAPIIFDEDYINCFIDLALCVKRMPTSEEFNFNEKENPLSPENTALIALAYCVAVNTPKYEQLLDILDEHTTNVFKQFSPEIIQEIYRSYFE